MSAENIRHAGAAVASIIALTGCGIDTSPTPTHPQTAPLSPSSTEYVHSQPTPARKPTSTPNPTATPNPDATALPEPIWNRMEEETQGFQKETKLKRDTYELIYDAADPRTARLFTDINTGVQKPFFSLIDESTKEAIEAWASWGFSPLANNEQLQVFIRPDDRSNGISKIDPVWPKTIDPQFPCRVNSYIVISNNALKPPGTGEEYREILFHELLHKEFNNSIGQVERMPETGPQGARCGDGSMPIEEGIARAGEIEQKRSQGMSDSNIALTSPLEKAHFLDSVDELYKNGNMSIKSSYTYGQWGVITYLIENYAEGNTFAEKYSQFIHQYINQVAHIQREEFQQANSDHKPMPIDTNAILLEMIHSSKDPELHKAQSVQEAVLYVMAKASSDPHAFYGARLYTDTSKKYPELNKAISFASAGTQIISRREIDGNFGSLSFSDSEKQTPVTITVNNDRFSFVAVDENGKAHILRGKQDANFTEYTVPHNTIVYYVVEIPPKDEDPTKQLQILVSE